MKTRFSNYTVVLALLLILLPLPVYVADVYSQWYRQTPTWKRYQGTMNLIVLKALLMLPVSKQDIFQQFSKNEKNTYTQMNRDEVSRSLYKEFSIDCDIDCRNYFLKINLLRWWKSTKLHHARWYYEHAIIFFQKNNYGMAILLLDLARNIEPKWSYFHLEYANALARLGHAEEAALALKECQKYPEAQSYCKVWQEDGILNSSRSQIVGFLSHKVINEILYE